MTARSEPTPGPGPLGSAVEVAPSEAPPPASPVSTPARRRPVPAGPLLQVRTAVESNDVREAARVIAEAFAPLDASAWLVPDEPPRRAVLAKVFAIAIAHAIDYGAVHLLVHPAGEVVAAAVWVERSTHVPDPPNYEAQLLAAAGKHTPAFQHLDELFDRHNPILRPHHHLAFVGVLPQHQSRGYGGELLQHQLERLDATGVPAYLEAAGTSSIPLYERNGFAISDDPFTLPNGASFQPMWRDAHGASGRTGGRA